MKTINVNCSKKFNIYINNGLLSDIHSFISELKIGNNILIISDDIVSAKYGKIVSDQLSTDYYVKSFVFENGEKAKNIDNLHSILSFLAENRFKRNDTIIALGGGVVGDIAGLAASLYMRGINLIQIPTTLLAMVDASIGGKTAIDRPEGKNLIGSFHQPIAIFCDTDIIKDLPIEIFNEGMGEVIKYGIISDNPILSYINNNTFDEHLNEIIEYCIKSKIDVVEKDENETKGIRKVLNAGHTFAHSLEKASNYNIPHGIAVATGLVYEAKIANCLKICDNNTVDQILTAVDKYDLLIDFPYEYNDLISYMALDKKNNDNDISFILPTRIGNCLETKISKNELTDIFNHIGEKHE